MKLYKLTEDFNPYDEYGGRKNYLRCLADDYGVPVSVVYTLASALGSSEDFDALVTEVEDYADSHIDDEEMLEDFEEQDTLTLNQKRALDKVFNDTSFTLFDGSNADVAKNIEKAFTDLGGKVYVRVDSDDYLRYDGDLNGYRISGSVSRRYIRGDLNRLAEDLTMAYYRTIMHGKNFNTPSLMKAILDESIDGGSKITARQRKELNKICYKYCGWKLPEEIAPLWDELISYGVSDIGDPKGFVISGYPNSVSESGTKSWQKSFALNEEPVQNSMFIYQVYEGNGDTLKNEYNIYFS